MYEKLQKVTRNIIELNELSDEALKSNFGFGEKTIQSIRIIGKVFKESGIEIACHEYYCQVGQGLRL